MSDAPDLPPIAAGHDPGPDAARRRVRAVEDVAADPIPSPGGMIRVGTASWTDPTMTVPGVFYPVGVGSAEERLHYYASRFPLVEVDATYYALPAKRTSELWLERTPPDFVFDIKAHALMTGQPTETKRLPKLLREELPAELLAKPRIYARDLPPDVYDAVWGMFLEGVDPLRTGGQLGSVLLQYPRWVFPSSESRAAIVEAKERLEGIQVAVEFRNGSWFNDKNLERTLRFLTDNAIPMVIVDGPQGMKSSIPPVIAVTDPRLAIVRFHGRRAETWEARGIPTVERFRYLYDRSELEEWVPRIAETASRARDTHVLMNNCFSNYGSTNARELAQMLLQADLAQEHASGGEAAGA